MKKLLVPLVVIAVVAALVLREAERWRTFRWSVFLQQAMLVNGWLVLTALALIYLALVLRSLRWKILLSPIKQTTVGRLVGPTLVGFAALALLGRPGEFARVYLIARRESLPVSSQFSIWMVERVLDLSTLGVLIGTALLVAPSVRTLPHIKSLQDGFLTVLGLAVGLICVLVWASRWGEPAITKMTAPLACFSPGLAARSASAIAKFLYAIAVIQSKRALLKLAGVSLLMWMMIAGAYFATVHSFPVLANMTVAKTLLLMGFSIIGSAAQLPGAGGSQLMVVAVLVGVFGASADVALSCGVMLWLTTHMAPVPAGLFLLRRYGLALRKLPSDGENLELSAGAIKNNG